eukprot:TRINITY_DN2455_c0_g1_i1.p1 TRINITY_DN2455_c0_g1~~TRINITY_DN2455_c0_g1_i1.p1  ORF type:complete len:213 (-),score=7.59 TRINITY_DN2455_c0_g1_i1:221-859(-)
MFSQLRSISIIIWNTALSSTSLSSFCDLKFLRRLTIRSCYSFPSQFLAPLSGSKSLKELFLRVPAGDIDRWGIDTLTQIEKLSIPIDDCAHSLKSLANSLKELVINTRSVSQKILDEIIPEMICLTKLRIPKVLACTTSKEGINRADLYSKLVNLEQLVVVVEGDPDQLLIQPEFYIDFPKLKVITLKCKQTHYESLVESFRLLKPNLIVTS